MLTRKKRDVSSSLFCIAVGILFIDGSIKFGDVRGGIPGPGFFPCVLGILLVILSALNIIQAVGLGEEIAIEKFFPQEDSFKKLSVLIVGMLGYAVILKPLGFLIATLLFILFSLKMIDPQKWGRTLILSSSVSIGAYILFAVLLKVQIPLGVMEGIH